MTFEYLFTDEVIEIDSDSEDDIKPEAKKPAKKKATPAPEPSAEAEKSDAFLALLESNDLKVLVERIVGERQVTDSLKIIDAICDNSNLDRHKIVDSVISAYRKENMVSMQAQIWTTISLAHYRDAKTPGSKKKTATSKKASEPAKKVKIEFQDRPYYKFHHEEPAFTFRGPSGKLMPLVKNPKIDKIESELSDDEKSKVKRSVLLVIAEYEKALKELGAANPANLESLKVYTFSIAWQKQYGVGRYHKKIQSVILNRVLHYYQIKNNMEFSQADLIKIYGEKDLSKFNLI